MKDSLIPIQVKFASDALIAQVLLEASSEKGYREFKDDKGNVFRATDYDPQLKQRVQVPIRRREDPKNSDRGTQPPRVGGVVGEGIELIQKTKKEIGNLRQEVGQSAPVKQAGKIAQEIGDIYRDPKTALRQVNSALLQASAKGLEKLVESHPQVAEKLSEFMFGTTSQQLRDIMADCYSELNPDLPNAIKPDPFKEFSRDLSGISKGRGKEAVKDVVRAFQLAGYQYNKSIDDLNHLEGPAAIKMAGKAIALSVPIAVFLGTTLTPEIAIGMMFGQSLSTILLDSGVALMWGAIADKAMDKARIDNPLARIVVNLLIGTAAPSGCLDLRGLYRLGYKQSAKEAKKMAAAIADEIPGDIPDTLDRVSFLTSGLGGEDRRYFDVLSAADKGIGKNFAKTYWIPFNDRKFYVSKEEKGKAIEKVYKYVDELSTGKNILGRIIAPHLEKPMDLIKQSGAGDLLGDYISVVKTLTSTFGTGRNPDAIGLASRVWAFMEKNPDYDKDIVLFGYSAGGIINNEALDILREMGADMKKLKAINIGTPHFGITSAKGVTNVVAREDELKFTMQKADYIVGGMPNAFKHGGYFESDRALSFLDWILGSPDANLTKEVSSKVLGFESSVKKAMTGKESSDKALQSIQSAHQAMQDASVSITKNAPDYKPFMEFDFDQKLNQFASPYVNSLFGEIEALMRESKGEINEFSWTITSKINDFKKLAPYFKDAAWFDSMLSSVAEIEKKLDLSPPAPLKTLEKI